MSRRKLRRGPRPLPGAPTPIDPGEGIRFPEVLGHVLRLAREHAVVEQRQIARWLDIPESTLSNLERGAMTATVFHLDAYAAALNELSSTIGPPFAPSWHGWEFHQVSTEIAERLRDGRGHAIVWAPPPEEGQERLFTSGRELRALVRAVCPEDKRRRL
jgi:hypothetical protein